jgi:hypothetical protein
MDIFDNWYLFEEPILEDVAMEPSLLLTHRSTVSRLVGSHQAMLDDAHSTSQISLADIPIPRSLSLLLMPSATISVSMSSPHGSAPSIYSNLVTIPSEMAPFEQA